MQKNIIKAPVGIFSAVLSLVLFSPIAFATSSTSSSTKLILGDSKTDYGVLPDNSKVSLKCSLSKGKVIKYKLSKDKSWTVYESKIKPAAGKHTLKWKCLDAKGKTTLDSGQEKFEIKKSSSSSSSSTLGEVKGSQSTNKKYVDLSWKPSSKVKSVKVYRATKDTTSTDSATLLGTVKKSGTTTYSDKKITKGKLYYYILSALDENGKELKKYKVKVETKK